MQRLRARTVKFIDTPNIESRSIFSVRDPAGRDTEVIQLVGDVRDSACLIVDDVISTGGTLAGSIEALLVAGALPDIWIAATHGLCVDDARAKLALDAVRGIWVTDSIAHDRHAWPQLHIVSVAPFACRGADGDSWRCFAGVDLLRS
jgi:phosphoribosylpyrophosphate synthetase